MLYFQKCIIFGHVKTVTEWPFYHTRFSQGDHSQSKWTCLLCWPWLERIGNSEIYMFVYLKDRHYEYRPIQIYWKFYNPKRKLFRKNCDIFHIPAQNIDCGYSLEPPHRGGSNEYPQSMFLSRNKKNNVYPCKPQLYYIKMGFKGVKII